MAQNQKESELRQTTVMFADISGFTAMSETMYPEEVTSIMNRCFSMMGSVIKENEGVIDKFIVTTRPHRRLAVQTRPSV